MKRNPQSFRTFLDQSFRRFRELPPADVTPGWERVLDRVREYPEGLSEDVPAYCDLELPVRSVPRRWPVWAAVFATVLSAVALTVAFWPRAPLAVVESMDGKLYRSLGGTARILDVGDKLHQGETVFSREGSGTTLLLQDGTHVEMRTNSELSFESVADGLRIQLHGGAVLVNAAKQHAGRHLHVRTKDVMVTVVGTVFLVTAEEEGSRVAVLEGQVRVTQGERVRRLVAGEQFASNPAMPPVSMTEEFSWSRTAAAQLALLQENPVASNPPLPQRSNEAPKVFEVASIREHVGGVTTWGEFRSSGRRAEYQVFSIQQLVMEAWNVRETALSPGVPANVVYPMMALGRSARLYEIAALAPEGTTPTRDEFRIMLRSLLATRFKLETHFEKRDKDVYVLQMNGTPRLKLNTSDVRCHGEGDPRAPGGQQIVWTHCPIQRLIQMLFVGRPIYDETGLTGFYDFEMTSARPLQDNDPAAITPFEAVKRLNLKLEPRQIQVDTIVIDHVEPPTEN